MHSPREPRRAKQDAVGFCRADDNQHGTGGRPFTQRQAGAHEYAGKDAEGKTGDGVGILLQISHNYFSKAVVKDGISIGGKREYGIGMFFFPQSETKCQKAMETFEKVLKEENLELRDIAKSYNLRGFSFREFLNLQTGMKFRAYSLEEILSTHEQIAKGVLSKVRPLDYFQDYLHHGFYPFFLEKRNFSENLLKTMNMMVEVDILLIKQIELKYLSKIKKLLYLLAVDGPKAPNVSQLANDIQTSRATVMNYIKYLADARLINMVYPKGEEFPKKPSKIMMHNSNLMYSIYPVKVEEQDVLDTFFANTMWKDHKVNKGDKNISFMVDEVMPFKICPEGTKIKNNPGVTYVLHKAEIGRGNQIPLWLFGFLY